MPRIPARILGAVATAALVIVPVATANTATASHTSHRHWTTAMNIANLYGDAVALHTFLAGVDGRSTRSIRSVRRNYSGPNAHYPEGFVRITGLTDRNHDGLDDDGKLRVRVYNNDAILTLRKNRTGGPGCSRCSEAYRVTDGGFVFKNRRSVLQESAQAFDRMLRFNGRLGADTWDRGLIHVLNDEMPPEVQMVSNYDGNRDGYDDDGRLTFLANGKAVTLTIGNTGRQVGKVTYGPTWKQKAPKRTHHPAAPPNAGSRY